MTWGEIEGTPFRLDGSDTPLPQNPNGQQFKIPNLSARERIALSLADKVAKKHRKANQINSEFKRYFSLILLCSLILATQKGNLYFVRSFYLVGTCAEG